MDINPNLSTFKKLAEKNNLIVFSYKFFSDWLTPLSIYHGLSKCIKGESFLLESIEGQEKVARFSFLGFDPIVTFKSKDEIITIKFYPDRNKSAYTLTQGVLGITSTYPVANQNQAVCTISAETITANFSS